MDAKLQARCDRQIENEKALRNMSTLESEASVKVGCLLYTALDLPVSDDSVYECKKILENKDGFFSYFRGALQSLLLLRMAVSENPETYIDSVIDIYHKLEKNTGITGLYSVLSAVIIAEQHGEQDIDAVIAQVVELFDNIKKNHPDRSNIYELAYVALMYLSGKADVRRDREIEIRGQHGADHSHYNMLNETGHATGKNQYMSIYGAFADLMYLEELGVPEGETVKAIGEVDDYLKKKTGYGVFSINKDMRKVLAAALTLQHYTIEIPKEKNADFAPEISIELLLFIVLMSLVAVN